MPFLDKYQSRNTSIELLRLCFMTMIVLYHAFVHGLQWNFFCLPGEDWEAYQAGLCGLCKCGVTGFIFISGYYGIKFRWNRFLTLIGILLFYCVIFGYIGQWGIVAFVQAIVKPWGGWWFVNSYVTIYALSPIINKGIEHLDEKQFRSVVLCLLFYEYVAQFISAADTHNTTFLLTVFLAARYTRIYPPPILRFMETKYLVSIIIAAGMLLFAIPTSLVIMGKNGLNAFFIQENNILLLAFTSALVLYFDKKPFTNKYINYLASSTLAVYLITDNFVVQKQLDTWLVNKILAAPSGYVYIPLLVVACLLVDKVRECLFVVVARLFHRV